MDTKLLIEKYRPRTIDNIILNDTLKSKITSFLVNNSVPNIIISGPPGTGKTSLILLIAKHIYKENYKEAVLELNASDNRGIEIINNNITYFCKKKITDRNKNNNPITKLVILDEADNITNKVQNIISKLLEDNTINTKFAFTCNNSLNIIEALQSRCLMIYIPLLTYNQINNKLMDICKKENIEYTEEALKLLTMNANGDIRYAINNLEVIHYGFGKIEKKNIYELCHQPQPEIIINLIQECVYKNIKKVITIIEELKNKGYCSNDILLTIINILQYVKIDEDIRINFNRILNESYVQICDGVDTNLQLYGCISRIILFMQTYKK
jgi:replication factor C subunit 2/4